MGYEVIPQTEHLHLAQQTVLEELAQISLALATLRATSARPSSITRKPSLQADRRALNITLNSIGTELTRDDRKKLYSNFGLLYPHGQMELAVAEDFDQIRQAMERVPPYHSIFTKVCGRLGSEHLGSSVRDVAAAIE